MQALIPSHLQLTREENLRCYLESQDPERTNATVCCQEPMIERGSLIDFWKAFPGMEHYLSQKGTIEEAAQSFLQDKPHALEVEIIFLRDWQHENFPSVILRFSKLTQLYIESPNLTKIPPEVFQIPSLRRLALRMPLLQDIPQETPFIIQRS